MSRESEETWAAALGCLIVGFILAVKVVFWGVLIWALIECGLWVGRQ